MTVLKLVSKSENAKHWGAKDVLESAMNDVKSGKIDPQDKLIVVYVSEKDGSFDTSFIQCGMKANEIIALLEIAKLNIHKDIMKTGDL